ncbi:MAG: ATP-binding protein, partial [Paracraurococcus sp.]
ARRHRVEGEAAAREAAHALILQPAPAEAPRPRRAPATPPPDILAQLAAARPAAPAALPPPSAAEETERRNAQLAILRAIMADPAAAFRPAPALLQDFLLRCRIEMLPGRPLDLPAFRRLLVLVLAGVTEAVEARAEWAEALERAATLPEDRQGAYLLLARAALEAAPCPSDLAIARVLGSVSRGRGRSALEFLEKQDAIACRADAAGRRIATLIGPGWETAPGDPEAAAT